MTGRRERPRSYCTRLLANDFRTLWDFYRDKVGLRPANGHGEPPYGEFVEGRRPVLAIFDRKLMAEALALRAGGIPPRATPPMLVGFSVRDVGAEARRLRRAGIPLLAPPTVRESWRLRTLHFRDPEGNIIELFDREFR